MIKPTKYKAKIVTMYTTDAKGNCTPEYREIEGYLAPASINQSYGDGEPKTEITWGLYTDSPYMNDVCMMGCGVSIYKSHCYTGFIDLEAIEDDN